MNGRGGLLGRGELDDGVFERLAVRGPRVAFLRERAFGVVGGLLGFEDFALETLDLLLERRLVGLYNTSVYNKEREV